MESTQTAKPTVLVTNDDSIHSLFLRRLVEALESDFKVIIAAPTEEQSWIGRAMSRRKTMSVEICSDFEHQAWQISGTPTDCVNIALGELLTAKPDLVISGINIGYNTSIPLIYSSGTVAGAMEGAFWGIPSIATSQEIPDHLFEAVTHSKGSLPPEMDQILRKSATHTAQFAKSLLKEIAVTDAIVHNLNYPSNPTDGHIDLIQTVPAQLQQLSLYRETSQGQFNFNFSHGFEKESPLLTDRQAIQQGKASWTPLNFSLLGQA